MGSIRHQIKGVKFQTRMRKILKLANELDKGGRGWTLEEVAELMNATDEKSPGVPFDAHYVYSVLYRAKFVYGHHLRDGIKYNKEGGVVLDGESPRHRPKKEPRVELFVSDKAFYALTALASLVSVYFIMRLGAS